MTAAGWVALAALSLAVAASLGLAFYPVYQGESETVSSSGVVTSSTDSATLIDENGTWAAVLLCVPVGLAVLGLWGALRRRKALVWIFGGVLLAFCVLGGFSIGLFYLPAGLLLLLAAGLTEGERAETGRSALDADGGARRKTSRRRRTRAQAAGWTSWMRFPHVSSNMTTVTEPMSSGSPLNSTPADPRRSNSPAMSFVTKAVAGMPAP